MKEYILTGKKNCCTELHVLCSRCSKFASAEGRPVLARNFVGVGIYIYIYIYVYVYILYAIREGSCLFVKPRNIYRVSRKKSSCTMCSILLAKKKKCSRPFPVLRSSNFASVDSDESCMLVEKC